MTSMLLPFGVGHWPQQASLNTAASLGLPLAACCSFHAVLLYINPAALLLPGVLQTWLAMHERSNSQIETTAGTAEADQLHEPG